MGMEALTNLSQVTHFGIADAHGIESFVPADADDAEKQLIFLGFRANFNRQRHAVLYFVKLDEAEIARVNGYLNKGDFTGALVYLKSFGKVYFAPSDLRLHSKSWRLIPNDDLDPWS